MSLQSFSYFLFLFVVTAVYLVLPHRLQPAFLLAASWVFYLLAVPTMFPLLVALCLFTYACGRGIGGAHKGFFVRLGVIGATVVLCFFKYFSSLCRFFSWGISLPAWVWPLGLSFYILAAISYLLDVYWGKCTVEHSFIRYALYLSLFLTVSQGPICRAGQLLPQLAQPHRFDAPRTVNGLRLFALGLFKAVAVSDLLGLLVNQVYADYTAYGGWMLTAAAVAYALQLYFSFSGYSEMARAGGLFLGLEIPENFKTPFFSTSYAEIWRRWHISLSSWLRDYIYIPLGGSRKGALRKQINLLVTFAVSGLWHGNTWLYLFWGLLQAVYQMAETLLHKIVGQPKSRQSAPVLWGKRAVVFYLWCIGLIFFRIGTGPNTQTLGLKDGFCYIGRSFCRLSLHRFGAELVQAVSAGFYANNSMVALYLVFVAAALTFAVYLEHQRCFAFANAPAEQVLARQKHRGLCDLLLICFILAGLLLQNGGFGSGGFGMYAGF